MKKLTNLLLIAFLTTTSLFSQDYIKKYKESRKELYSDDYVTVEDSNLSFVLRPCDINDDFKVDFWEMYGNPPSKEFLDSLSKFSSIDYFKNKMPDGHIFDFDGDGLWKGEVWWINMEKDTGKFPAYFRITSRKEVEI